MTLEDKVHAFRLRLFRRAEELGNISAACREAGISRSLYYQLRGRFERYGSDGLHPKHRQGRPGRPPLLDAQIERRILAVDALDTQIAREKLVGATLSGPFDVTRCDFTGAAGTVCEVDDLFVLERLVRGAPTPLENACPAYGGP